MADIAASGITFLTDAHSPGTDNKEPPLGVEYWEVVGDGAGVTVPITARYGRRPVAGSCGIALSYAISGSTITFTFAAAVSASSKYLARILTKP